MLVTLHPLMPVANHGRQPNSFKIT